MAPRDNRYSPHRSAWRLFSLATVPGLALSQSIARSCLGPRNKYIVARDRTRFVGTEQFPFLSWSCTWLGWITQSCKICNQFRQDDIHNATMGMRSCEFRELDQVMEILACHLGHSLKEDGCNLSTYLYRVQTA